MKLENFLLIASWPEEYKDSLIHILQNKGPRFFNLYVPPYFVNTFFPGEVFAVPDKIMPVVKLCVDSICDVNLIEIKVIEPNEI